MFSASLTHSMPQEFETMDEARAYITQESGGQPQFIDLHSECFGLSVAVMDGDSIGIIENLNPRLMVERIYHIAQKLPSGAALHSASLPTMALMLDSTEANLSELRGQLAGA